MDNWKVAAALERMAGLLALKGEKDFKVRAYSQAARRVIRSAEPLADLIEAGRLEQLPGIGKALARKIEEIVSTGQSEFLARLEAEVSSSLLALFEIPGVGYKTAANLVQGLNLKSMEQLAEAAREGKVAGLAGLGRSLEQNILFYFNEQDQRPESFYRGVAVPLAGQLEGLLCELPVILEVRAAGEIRRGTELVTEIVLLAILNGAADSAALEEALRSLPGIRAVLTEESGYILENITGLPVHLLFTQKEAFPVTFTQLTGSEGHWAGLIEIARGRGLTLNRAGLWNEGNPVFLQEEKDLYTALGLPLIPPELREGGDEFEAAAAGRLPRLIEPGQIRGDLHLHTDWSDGTASIEEMAKAAEALGYEYICVTDHSPSLQIAGGLSLQRLRKQIDQIRRFNEANQGCHVFSGMEVDIKPDGSLDLPDPLLDELDFVVASVHSHFKQDREIMTARICRAMAYPAVHVIGHPTGRLLGSRGAYHVDVEQLIRQAATTGTILEINASPQRLDLPDIYLRQARDAGVRFSINTDAHSTVTMADMFYGVTAARRGWLEAADVLNTLSKAELEQTLPLKRRRGWKG